jgi:hypothetical protein
MELALTSVVMALVVLFFVALFMVDHLFQEVHCPNKSCQYTGFAKDIRKTEYKTKMQSFVDHGGTDPYEYDILAKVWSCPLCGTEIAKQKI